MHVRRAVMAALPLLWLHAKPAAAALHDAAPEATHLQLNYGLYSHSFHVMSVAVDATLTQTGYAITLHSQSTGLIGLLIRNNVTSTASGRFDDVHALPTSFASTGYSRGADRVTRIDYVDGVPQVRALSPVDPDRDPVPASATANTIDTLSGMLSLIRMVERTGHCNGGVRLFDGIRLSAMTARTAGTQPPPAADRAASTALHAGPALRCDFVGQQLAGFLHNADEAKMRQPQHGSAWLAQVLPDAPMLPISVTFEHPHIGELDLRLETAVTLKTP